MRSSPAYGRWVIGACDNTCQFFAHDRRAPFGFDVLNHQPGTACMADKRPRAGIVQQSRSGSRASTTWKPSRVICRAPNARLRMQMFVWTPIRAMLVIPSC